MASKVAISRLRDLMKAQCTLFSTTFNPQRLRTGNKILRQRLKGPILAAYYPRRSATIEDMKADFEKYHGLTIVNDDEIEREEELTIIKARGKGAPKKKREKDVSKKKKR